MALEEKFDRRVKHGMHNTPEYHAYQDAKYRCSNPNNPRYPWYGKRGINFKFGSFEEFFNELGHRPSKNHSLDRIDNEGDYEPGNVRWATKYEQIHNRRKWDTPWLIGNNHNVKSYLITCPDGTKQKITNMKKFCKEHGLNAANLHKTIEGKLAKTHKGYKAEAA